MGGAWFLTRSPSTMKVSPQSCVVGADTDKAGSAVYYLY